MRRIGIVMALVGLVLGACVNKGVNDVALGDAGQAYKVKFGTVLEAHKVNIRSKPDEAVAGGALIGAGAGAGLGHSYASTLEGMFAGAIAGAVAQSVVETGNGIEYTIAFSDGTTQVIDQVQAPEDPVFEAGAPVMVQFGATRNRVLSAANLPTMVAHPKEVRVAGSPKPPHDLKSSTCQKTAIGTDELRKTCTDQ